MEGILLGPDKLYSLQVVLCNLLAGDTYLQAKRPARYRDNEYHKHLLSVISINSI